MTSKSRSKKASVTQGAARATGPKASSEANAESDPIGTVNEERGLAAHSALERPVDRDFSAIHDSNMHGSVHDTHDSDAVSDELHSLMGDQFQTPRNLDAPAPRPGYVQRWVRCEAGNQADSLNLQKQRRNGWVARPLSTIPKSWQAIGTHSNHPDSVYVAGQLLCERPLAFAERARRIVAKKNAAQQRYVSEQISSQNARGAAASMPLLMEERQEVETAGGRRPPVMDD